MNKIHKLIKSSKQNVINRAIVAGVLASVLSFGTIMPVYAASNNSIGEVVAFSKDSNPAGYLLCDGRAVSRTTYAKLFAEIGTKYGAGDGSTTFNLPNLVNRFVEGSRTAGTYIDAGLPNIKGSLIATTQGDQNKGGGAITGTIVGSGDEGGQSNELIRYDLDASKASAVYGNSTTVQPPALTMRYFIKVTDDATFDDNLHVKGTSQLDKATTIGTSSANANLTVNGSETVTGTITSNGKITSKAGVAAGGKVTGVTAGTADTDALNVKQLKDEVKVADNGNYVKTGNTTAANLTALDTQTKTNTDGLAAEITNRTKAINDERSAREATDTLLANHMDDIDKMKANKDATNVGQYAQDWADAIGTGKVVADDTKLVTGKTVYDALHDPNMELNVKSVTAQTINGGDVTVNNGLTVYGDTHLYDTYVDGILDVTGESTFHDNVTVEKDFAVDGKSVFEDDVHMKKNLDVDGKATINSLEVEKDGTVGGNWTVKGNESVEGDSHIYGNQTVDGKSIVGSQEVLGDSVVNGNQTIKKDTDMQGSARVRKDLIVDGNGKVGKDLVVIGNTDIGENLHVKGESQLDGTVTMGSDASVAGDFSVAGNTNLKDTLVDGTLEVNKEATFHDNVIVDKGLSVAGNANISKDFVVEGTSTLKGDVYMNSNAEIGEDLTVKGNSDLQGNTHVGKDLTVDGNTNIGRDLHVSGESKLDGNVAMGSDASVARNFFVAGDTNLKDTLVDGTLTVNNEATFHNNVAMDKDLMVAGNTNIDKNLAVTGISNLNGNTTIGTADKNADLWVNGNATVTGDTNMKGNVDIGKNLHVVGTSQLDGVVTTGSDVNVGGDLSVAGNIRLHGTLMDGVLEVNKEAIFHDNVTVDKSLAVAGNGSFGGDITAEGNAKDWKRFACAWHIRIGWGCNRW